MSKLAKMTKEFDVYDFDKTVYSGDCSLDFYLFCVRKKPLLLAYLPYQLWHSLLFILKREDRTSFKGHFFVFLHGVADVADVVDRFWDGHYRHIKDWYAESDHSKDIIISASPEFLLQPIAKRLQVSVLIATRMNAKSGIIEGKNCRGREKVLRLKQLMGNVVIGKAYTDSMSDMPLLSLAKEKYIVKHHRVMALKDYDSLSSIRRWFL